MRIHNTQKPVETLKPVAQRSFERKPRGLWWGIGRDWHAAVSGGRTRALREKSVGTYDYRVELPDDFNLLQLSGWADLRGFSEDFGQPMPHAAEGFFWQRPETRWRYDADQDPQMPHCARAFLIDWPKVARLWDGIEVLDLGAGRTDRPKIEWLDIDWDIASGCAWNVEKLRLTLIMEPEETPEP